MKAITPQLILCMIFGCLASCGSPEPSDDGPENTPFLTVEKRELTIDHEGGTLYASVSSNVKVTATPEKTWCKVVSFDEQTDKNNLKLSIEPNNGEERKVGILLTAPGCSNIELTVTQDKYDNSGSGGDDKDYLQFRAASYNVRYAAAADETSGNGWAVRKKPLTDLIRSHDFDIVGTQEANNNQIADMASVLTGYDYVKHPYGGNNTGTSHNCAIFYKKALFDVVDSGVWWYSTTPDVASYSWDATDLRICNWVKFREKKTKVEFYFFNSHFYWQFTEARQKSGPLMVEKIKQIAGDAPAISVGDLNSTSSTSQILAIMTLLRDAYDVTETTREGPEGTGFPGGVFQGTPGSRIDYIFLSPHFRALDYAVLTDSYNNGRYPSDHLPVTSMLAIEIEKED